LWHFSPELSVKIKEKPDEIILREIPFGSWAIGLLVLSVFGIMALAIAADILQDPRSYFGSLSIGVLYSLPRILMALLLFVFIGLMLAVGFYMLFSPIITTRTNRNFKSVEITKRRYFYKRSEKYFFSQIIEFSRLDIDAGTAFECFLALVLTNNVRISITSTPESSSKIDEIAEKLNAFIKSAK